MALSPQPWPTVLGNGCEINPAASFPGNDGTDAVAIAQECAGA
jgi:hypothetical protein